VRAKVRQIVTAPPLLASAIFFTAALIFGWSRNFGTFLLGLFALPALLLIALACFAVAVTRKSRRGIRPGLLLLVAAPFAAYATSHLRDRVRFVVWEIFHAGELGQLTGQDRIITGWDGWGMAGSENDSYLIADVRDDSATRASAERWRKRMRLECPIVATQKMARRLYIVTTYECPFDGIPVPD
jgi:hypothetical protein